LHKRVERSPDRRAWEIDKLSNIAQRELFAILIECFEDAQSARKCFKEIWPGRFYQTLVGGRSLERWHGRSWGACPIPAGSNSNERSVSETPLRRSHPGVNYGSGTDGETVDT